MRANQAAAIRFFSDATSYVESVGLSAELSWQRTADFPAFTENELLREHAWVTLCSGFREAVVRRIFDHVSLCFCDWESADAIVSAGDICYSTAALSFANKAKLRGILSASGYIHHVGFDSFKKMVLADPITQLQKLPFIGSVTSWHLAKNLGLAVAKPDRHLVRVSELLGFRSANHLCQELAAETGEQVNVVDLIVWRYVADNPWRLRELIV